jgi:hypothetical protein
MPSCTIVMCMKIDDSVNSKCMEVGVICYSSCFASSLDHVPSLVDFSLRTDTDQSMLNVFLNMTKSLYVELISVCWCSIDDILRFLKDNFFDSSQKYDIILNGCIVLSSCT